MEDILQQEQMLQTRALWKSAFPQDSDEFLDIYFADKYKPERNIVRLVDGEVAAATQLLPYRMNFYGASIHVGYISGLCTREDQRGKGLASQIISEVHRRLYAQGGVLSLLIPGDAQLRHFYEQPHHGAYWTSTFRCEVVLRPQEKGREDYLIEEPEEWGRDLYVFYNRMGDNFDFILRASESDFFAAVDLNDLEGGILLTAKKGRKLVGLCMAQQNADGKVMIKDMMVTDPQVENALVNALCQRYGVEEIYENGACAGALSGATPYAMARVVNVVKFFKTILLHHPGLELHIGVDGDFDIPENNGFYLLKGGKVFIVDECPEQIVTPGGLATMFLGSQPTVVRSMLDE